MYGKKVTVILTHHFQERYRERVGNAPATGQRAWVTKSLQARRPRRQDDGRFTVKLLGSQYVVVLARENNVWVAITIE